MNKDKECVGCKHFFECEGKPEGVDYCLNYEDRKKKEKRRWKI